MKRDLKTPITTLIPKIYLKEGRKDEVHLFLPLQTSPTFSDSKTGTLF
jgi:hypothetical protein